MRVGLRVVRRGVNDFLQIALQNLYGVCYYFAAVINLIFFDYPNFMERGALWCRR